MAETQKGEVFLIHAIKAYRGKRGIAPPILNLGIRWRTVINVTFRPFNPGKESGFPLNHPLCTLEY